MRYLASLSAEYLEKMEFEKVTSGNDQDALGDEALGACLAEGNGKIAIVYAKTTS